MSINRRFSILIDHFENGKQSAFCRKTGIKTTTLSNIVGGRKTDPSSKILNSVLEAYPDIDAYWLVTGNGEMLKGEGQEYNEVSSKAPPPDECCKLCDEKDKVIETQKEQIKDLKKDKEWLQKQINPTADSLKSRKLG